VGTRPAARSHRQKAAILARFKGNNTRRPLFFSACVGIVLANDISARKFSRREVGGPASCSATASGSRATTHGGTFDILPPPLTSFERLQPGSALGSKHCGPVWRQSQLTDAIGLSGAAVVENYYVGCSAPRLLPYAMQSCAPSACAARP
jgi:hypothetical protein